MKLFIAVSAAIFSSQSLAQDQAKNCVNGNAKIVATKDWQTVISNVNKNTYIELSTSAYNDIGNGYWCHSAGSESCVKISGRTDKPQDVIDCNKRKAEGKTEKCLDNDDIPVGSIIGRIGTSGVVFNAANRVAIVSDSDGPLMMKMNDLVGSWVDNTGGANISYKICSP